MLNNPHGSHYTDYYYLGHGLEVFVESETQQF